eukprot:7938012-Pyramimonas_sp.AAC.1
MVPTGPPRATASVCGLSGCRGMPAASPRHLPTRWRPRARATPGLRRRRCSRGFLRAGGRRATFSAAGARGSCGCRTAL